MNKKILGTKKLSIMEGMMFNGFFNGIQGFVLTTLALYFNASPLILAIISTLPVIAQVMQIFTMKIYKVLKTRKRILIITAFMSRIGYVVLPICVILGYKNPYILLLVIVSYSIFGTFVGNVWNASMKNIISEKERGIYFGKRNLFCSLASMVFLYLYGYILKHNTENKGVLIVTILMAASAIVTVLLLKLHYVPDLEEEDKEKVSIFQPLKNKNFRKFLIFTAYWTFSVELVKPFFSYYQIHVLNIDKEFLGLMSVITGIISVLIYLSIGKMTDKFGNRMILTLGMFVSTYNLLIYLFMNSENFKFLLILDAIFNAFAWSAINLAFFNLLLEVTEKPMEAYNGLYSLVLGLSALASSLVGGIIGNLVQNLQLNIFGEIYEGIKIIFVIGFLVRIFAILHLTNVDSYLKPLKYKGMLSVSYVISKRMNMYWGNTIRNLKRK